MSGPGEKHLLATFERCAKVFARELITAREFVNKIFDEFAHADRVYPEIVPALWELLPEGIRGEFTASIREAVLPSFVWHPFYIGGGRPMTEEELRRDAELRTSRVRAWAQE